MRGSSGGFRARRNLAQAIDAIAYKNVLTFWYTTVGIEQVRPEPLMALFLNSEKEAQK